MAGSESNTEVNTEPWLQGAVRVTRSGQSAPSQHQVGPEKAGAVDFSSNEFKRGLASMLGLPLDTMSNIVNLAIAGYGTAKGLAGGTDLPELRPSPLGGHKTFEKILGVRELQPETKTAEMAGDVARVVGSSALPAFGFASRSAAPIASLAAQGGLATAAGVGGFAGKELVPENLAPAGEMAGQIVGGVIAPARIASILEAGRNIGREGSTQARRLIDPYAEQIVRNRMVEATKGFHAAERNLADAAALERNIPGLQYRAGQASGVPSIMSMEDNLARSSGANLNARISAEQAQRAAIESRAAQNLPVLSRSVEPEISRLQGQQRSLAQTLPEQISQQEAGQQLRTIRSGTKARFDAYAADKFGAAAREAERLAVKIDASDIYERAAQLKQNPLLAFDETNLPAVVRRIDASQKVPEQNAPGLLGPSGQPISKVASVEPGPIPFSELTAMRTAVNQDIAKEAGYGSPNARQRLRALVDIKQSIDRAAAQAPESVSKLYQDASQWYRDVYAPKFLRGINLKQGLSDITGERKIADERLVSAYFKAGGATPMKRFIDLYGDSPQAMSVMRDSIMNRYSSDVVRDGVIDPNRHKFFMAKYSDALNKVPSISRELADVGTASEALARHEQRLASLQSVISKGNLNSLRSDSPDVPGLDAKKLERFIKLHEPDLHSAISAVHGKQVADEHIRNLKEISKAAQIADRGFLGPQTAVSGEALPTMKERTGFTFRTVMSLYRAIVTGRTSPQDMGTVLGTQYAGNVITKALRAAEERAISDPETAKMLMKAQSTPITTAEGKRLILDLLRKGGAYWSGLPKMQKYGELRMPSLSAELNTGETAVVEEVQQSVPIKEPEKRPYGSSALQGVRG
jgi:hypothetical protein